MATGRPASLDLSRPRNYGELLTTSIAVFRGHASVFLSLALVLVAPATLAIDGVWGRTLADGVDAKPPLAAQTIGAAVRVFVILPLVTAATVLIVQGLARGDEPTVGGALRAGAAAFPRVLGAVIVYVAVVLAGFLLLIVPGIWLSVRGYFAAQAAVIDDLPPVAALRRSSELVQGSWWRTFLIVLATGVLFALGGSILIGLVGATGSAALYVAALMIVGAAALSLTAIFATLLFFDLRVRGESRPDGVERMSA